jgi:hypothetical protein
MSHVTSRNVRFWHHPSRILLAEESILAMAVAAAGCLYLFAWLPKPIMPPAATDTVQKLKASFSRGPGINAGVPLLAASQPMIHAIRHAQKREARGAFDETTRAAWQSAGDEIRKLSFLPIATSDGRVIRLWMREGEEERAAALETALEELLPGRFAALEEQRRAAVAADPSLGESLPEVTWFAVVDNAPAGVRHQAFTLCMLREEARTTAALIGRYRDIVGYDHWKAACAVGASPAGLQAHAALWRAGYDVMFAQFDLAKDAYEEGFRAWQTVCETSPAMRSDPLLVAEMKEHLERYHEVLTTLQAPVNNPAVLQDVIGDLEPIAL